MEQALLKQTRNLIASRIGLLVREQDEGLLRKVIDERVRMLNLSGVEQYCRFLDSDADISQEREELANPLTTGETYFLRDSGLHELLKNTLLPELFERRKGERAVRIWCAACSSGEEAYSLAILLDELMADQSRWNIFILGTDINHEAIQKARQGIYSEWSFRGMSDERRQRYFHPHKNTWALDDAIRSRVIFRTGDLVADAFPDRGSDLHGMDLILCRNMFIYMEPRTVSRIADKLTETLVEGGILITGHGELYAHHLGNLRARVFTESIVYQKATRPYIFPTPAPLSETHHQISENSSAVVGRASARHVGLKPELRSNELSGLRSANKQSETRNSPPEQKMAVSEMQQAWQYANQGQRDQAAKSCVEMVAKNPLAAEPHYLLALLAQERGDDTETKALLKKAIYLDHSFIAAYLDLGDLYEREGDSVRAIKMRETARDLLKNLPSDEPLKLYGASTANAVLQYVEHLLSAGK
jgi:chemotaxis protein methyltransferase CheR